MNKDQINQITHDSIENKITFLDAIKKLRNLGVWGYRVEINTNSKIIFDQNSSMIQKGNGNTVIQRQFVKQKVIDAIRLRQNNKTSFNEFIDQLGEAGVFDYIVDIAGKNVIYRGLFEQYEEKMPI